MRSSYTQSHLREGGSTLRQTISAFAKNNGVLASQIVSRVGTSLSSIIMIERTMALMGLSDEWTVASVRSTTKL